MPHLSISLLGPFEARLDGEVVQHFDSVKVRALLAYLAAESGRPHSRVALAGLLWPDYPEPSAQKSLRQALYSLRKTLGDPPCLVANREFITLISDENSQIDTLELERALTAARGPLTTDDRKVTADYRLPTAIEAVDRLRSAVGL